MKLYSQLQVQPAQRAVMAERWRSWCRRRRGLDTQLVAALENFQVFFCLLYAELRSFLAARGARPNTPPFGAHVWSLLTTKRGSKDFTNTFKEFLILWHVLTYI
jgi:hypothetical protein